MTEDKRGEGRESGVCNVSAALTTWERPQYRQQMPHEFFKPGILIINKQLGLESYGERILYFPVLQATCFKGIQIKAAAGFAVE